MRVLFVGGFTGSSGTGETPDEIHMARCLDQSGISVENMDRAEWHAFFTGAKPEGSIPPAEAFDIIVLCKWGHYTEEMIKGMKERYKGKIVYWVWDWMMAPHRDWWTPDWHKMILKNCDYYVSGELGMKDKIEELGAEFRYFNWDSSDGQYDALPRDEKYDVVFTGTYIPHSYRNALLEQIGNRFDLTVFSFDYLTWREHGFKAEPGLYSADYKTISAQARVIVCMNWVEPSEFSTGYQSNRIGKILTTGGMPVVHYFPMAERMLGDNVMFFYKDTDMINTIDWLLGHPEQRETQRIKGYDFGRREYTTQTRMRQFKVLLESL